MGVDESVPYLEDVRKYGLTVSINGKSNVGLGRPLASI